jgi:hypothetical protein
LLYAKEFLFLDIFIVKANGGKVCLTSLKRQRGLPGNALPQALGVVRKGQSPFQLLCKRL